MKSASSAKKPLQQFDTLNTFRRERTLVTVYMVNGVRQVGRIRSFDAHALLLDTGVTEALIYHHAVSTVAKASGSPRRRDGPPRGEGAPRRDDGHHGYPPRGPGPGRREVGMRGDDEVPRPDDPAERGDDDHPPRRPPLSPASVPVSHRKRRFTPPTDRS